MKPHDSIGEVLENQIWMGLSLWRESFVVPFIASTVPAWSDASFHPIQWDSPPRSSGSSGWEVVCSPATDPEGWVYGTAFDHLRDERPGGRASKRVNDRVRSRLWRRRSSIEQGSSASATPSVVATAGSQPANTSSSSNRAPPANPAAAAATKAVSAAASAVHSAAEHTAAAGKAALNSAAQAVQTAHAVSSSVKKASLTGMWSAFSKLLKDAAERHNTAMITPDLSGWFFVISGHGEELKKQQLSQLQHLVWFTGEQHLQMVMQDCSMGSNVPGVVLPARRTVNTHQTPQQAANAADDTVTSRSNAIGLATDSAIAANGRKSSGTKALRPEQQQQKQYELPGRPFSGTMMFLGAKGPSTTTSSSSSRVPATADSSRSANPASQAAAATAGSGLQLHLGNSDMLDDLIAGARYSQAAYGYVAAGGHLSSVSSAIKLLATLPLFDPITGVSLQANIQALMTLAGLQSAEDILLTAWNNDTFRPCHYVAVDRTRRNIVLAVRGSLEVGDLETDVTAAPLSWEFQGVSGWVHEGLLAAAAYVVANTVDALAEAAARNPGWPLVVAGHSLGGGVAALVTLLLQQPGAAPRGISSVRCVCIGPAAVLSQELNEKCEEYVTSVVLGADMIPRLSTYSVESLLLDLVNASISRRVTTQLAATTSSVAATTGAAINSITQGIARLANSATDSVNNVAGALAGSLADNYLTGSFTSLAGLAGSFQPIPAVQQRITPGGTPGGATGGTVSSTQGGTNWVKGSGGNARGSLEMAKVLQDASLEPDSAAAAAAAAREISREGLKQLHDMLHSERCEKQDQESWSKEYDASVQQGRVIASEDAAAVAAESREEDLLESAAAVSSSSSGKPVADILYNGPSNEPPANASTAAGSSSGSSGGHVVEAPSTHNATQKTAASSSSSSPAMRMQRQALPGAAKSVQGPSTLIFPRVDDARIISGIQQACAEINANSSTTGFTGSTSGFSGSTSVSAAGSYSGTAADKQQVHCNQTKVAQKTTKNADLAPGGPFAAAGHNNAQCNIGGSSSSNTGVHEGSTESELQQWASDGLQPLGDPSWVRMQQQNAQDSAAAAAGSSGGQQGVGSSSSDLQQNTVDVLESDLKQTVRLYPPGRILWVLTDDLVGPAAHQLMTAVAAHLASTRPAESAAAAASSSRRLGPAKSAPPGVQSAAAAAAGEGGRDLQPPVQAQMEMPVGVCSKPSQQQQQQQRRLSKRSVAQDTAAAHAVAAANARHIFADVHSIDAKRTAAAALHAAQREHPPLHLHDSASTQTTVELQRQQQQQADDLAVAEAAVDPANIQQQQQQGQHTAQSACKPKRQDKPGVMLQMTNVLSRAIGKPLEVDGSSSAANDYSTADPEPQDLPADLQEVIRILGQPTDASSALAIAHKKQLLLQHYYKQQRQDATQQQQQETLQQQKQQRGDIVRQLSRQRSGSQDSSLLRYEDMVPTIDEDCVIQSGETQSSSSQQQQHGMTELELVSQSSRSSSTQSSGVLDSAIEQQQQQLHSICSSSGSRSRRRSAMRHFTPYTRHYRSHSWSSPGLHSGSAAAAAEGYRRFSSSITGRCSDDLESMWDLPSTLCDGVYSQQQQQQQQVQLSLFSESEDYVFWAAEQAALHKQRQDEQQQRRQQQQRAAEQTEGMSLQEMAVGSLIELAQLPERIAESLSTMRSASGTPKAVAGGKPREDSGLAALCAPMMNPAAAGAPVTGGSNDKGDGERMPVIVMPERDVFGKLLVHKTAFQDHLPSSYVRVLQDMKTAYMRPAFQRV